MAAAGCKGGWLFYRHIRGSAQTKNETCQCGCWLPRATRGCFVQRKRWSVYVVGIARARQEESNPAVDHGDDPTHCTPRGCTPTSACSQTRTSLWCSRSRPGNPCSRKAPCRCSTVRPRLKSLQANMRACTKSTSYGYLAMQSKGRNGAGGGCVPAPAEQTHVKHRLWLSPWLLVRLNPSTSHPANLPEASCPAQPTTPQCNPQAQAVLMKPTPITPTGARTGLIHTPGLSGTDTLLLLRAHAHTRSAAMSLSHPMPAA